MVPLGHRDMHTLCLERPLEKVAIGGDDDEVLSTGEEQFVLTGGSAVLRAEAIFSGLDAHVRLNDAIHGPLIAQPAVGLEGVKDGPAVGFGRSA